MTEGGTGLTTEEKRRLLRERLAAGRKISKTYPASYSQRRLWFMHKLAPESPAYNVEAALPLNAIDAGLLERAINAILERHEALRTTFIEIDGEPIQRVAPEMHVPLERIDLAALSPAARDRRLAEIRRDCATEEFDLARGPLVQTRLVKLGPARHVFLLHLHHILADGWSMGVFTRELAALFEAFARNKPSPLPPLALQYGDFSAWQRRAGDGDGFAAETVYWVDKLAGMTTLELPTDYPRPATQSYSGAFHNCTFSRDLTARFEAFSHERGVTPFMTLLTAFKALLSRLACQEDVAVGTYIANREAAEVEALIGFFLNTLVLRTNIPRQASFSEALDAVKETALGAYANQSLPFERLVEILKPPRDLARNPLVQVVFQLQNAVNDEPAGGGALVDYQRSAAAFDLAVTAYRQDEKLHFTYEYATDLFGEATVARMAARFEQLLRQALDAPETAIAELDVLLEDERERLPRAHGGDTQAWLEQPVTTLFATAASEAPDVPAFYVGEACATIGQVKACADRIAHALVRAEIGKGDVVATCMPRSVELAASLMAIWQVGAVYLPLDPAYPAARLRFMVEDSAARIAIVRRGAGEDLPDAVGRIDVNAAIGDLSEPAPECTAVPLDPDDPSHIIYTSGSTGRPKGALSPHRQVLNRLHWMWNLFPHAPHEVEVVKTATSFIDSLWELAGPMIAGCPATIVDAPTLLDPPALAAQLARDGVTRMWLTPSYLRLLLESLPDLGAQLPSLSSWFVTGEKLPAELVNRFRAAAPGARLVNLYGTSEAWDICCDPDIAHCEPVDPVPVGVPLSNIEIAILDRFARPVPDCIPGELHVAGAATPLGFVNRDDLDAARFVAFEGIDGTVTMLSTGDRARRNGDGRVEILGRMDEETKISGMRIQPAEVEACLQAMDGVATAAVAGVVAPDGTTRLWAWFVADEEASIDPAELRAALANQLPGPMVPEQTVQVAAIPRTPSNKVDRRALVHQALATANTASNNARKTGGRHGDAIAEIFSEMLGRPVGVDENFFSAGGHSLLAARALARINERLSLDLAVRDFFLDPSAAGLASRAEQVAGDAGTAAIRRLPRRAKSGARAPDSPDTGGLA